VDDLDLAVARKGLGVGRQARGVPAVVAGELAGQVRGGRVLGEGAEELGAVGAVELDGGAGLGGGALSFVVEEVEWVEVAEEDSGEAVVGWDVIGI
jgi:hypothetical protein